MLRAISEEEIKQWNKEMVAWVKKTLEGENGHLLRNLLNELKEIWEVKAGE